MNPGSFKNVINKMCLQIIYLVYMYKQNLALNNLQGLIYHKTQPKQTKPRHNSAYSHMGTHRCVSRTEYQIN